jgi:TolB protein
MRQLINAAASGLAVCGFLSFTASGFDNSTAQSAASTAAGKSERHLRNIRKLTSGGENAEAYFSADGTRLIYQSTRPEYPCDQIYTMRIDGSDRRRVSTGTGRTTCGYFYPAGDEILFASTHEASAACPPRPSFERGYVWPIYDGYEIYRAKADGSNLRPLTRMKGYDAEATIAPDGLITFTSVRDGDMEIYTMKGDGSDVRRLTNRPGPDGGPFFSYDGQRIVFRGRPLEAGKELDDYRALLKEGLWRPTQLELRDEPRRQRPASGHQARQRQLRAVLASRWQAPGVRVEHP